MPGPRRRRSAETSHASPSSEGARAHAQHSGAKLEYFDQDAGADKTKGDLVALVESVDLIEQDGAPLLVLNTVFEMDRFVDLYDN